MVAEEDANGVIMKVEVLDEEFPRATAQGNPIFGASVTGIKIIKGRIRSCLLGPSGSTLVPVRWYGLGCSTLMWAIALACRSL